MKNIDKPWISPAIRNSIRTKSNYFKLFKQGIISHERNNAYKRVLSKTIRAAKRNYFFNYFELNMNNVKKSWDGIRNLMGNNRQKKNVKAMFINGESTADEQKIADAFNFYFSNVAKKLDDEIPNLAVLTILKACSMTILILIPSFCIL